MARLTAQEREWRAKSDMDALQRAAEIQGDKARMAAVRATAAKEAARLSAIAKKPAATPRKSK